MTDPELLAKKLAEIETYVRELVTERLGDLTAYAAAIRSRLPADQVGG